MIIDEFEYWERSKDFSDPWYKSFCHKVNTNWGIVRSFIDTFIYKNSIDV